MTLRIMSSCAMFLVMASFGVNSGLSQSPPAGADAGHKITVHPLDNGQALVNPGMGWTLHFYSNVIKNYGSQLAPSDTLDDWPGLSTIYLRVPWSFLEPEEGQFNWSLFDTPAQRWIAKGKKIAIRVTCCESWWQYATPKWVRDAGAKGVDFECGKGPTPGGSLWEPDYQDPIFLAKLAGFLGELTKRYDGNPNVAFIDIGSFGMWGEGHTCFSSRLTQAQTLEVAKTHIDLYVKHFPHTLLCISDDVAGPGRQGAHFPETDYALSRGVTLRDDSILVSLPPHSWFHAEMAQAFWPRWPVILEHEHYGPSKARHAWNNDLLVKAVEDYHASYMSIHWWPRIELQECREAVERINRRLGYRLQLQSITWPATITAGKPFAVETSWANAGVTPCYPGGYWTMTLKDAAGGIAVVLSDEKFNMKDLQVGPAGKAPAKNISTTFTAAFRHAGALGVHAPPMEPGKYGVYVSVGQRDGTPRIALPLAGDDGQHRYRLGEITLEQ